ncbi:hypothetical protein [Saccharopolyspora sp. 5N708]|uniref:hypothetical protein n=1 Tax=Saccharopolyspora sp. 5N708 TaxID=3457424 RepID=UPI003FD4357F
MCGSKSEAEAGDPVAAREFGRLLCLSPPAAEEETVAQLWPGERWLRVALTADPGDSTAAKLLAARLIQQIDFMQVAESAFDEDDDVDEAIADRHGEAAELYDRILRADPDDRAAREGLAMLRGVVDGDGATPAAGGYSYYLVQLDSVSGSAGHYEELVVTDVDELRWACDNWFRREGPRIGFTLAAVISGERGRSISLDPVRVDDTGATNWDAVVIPPLSGELLPIGSPACSDAFRYHYGYTLHLCLQESARMVCVAVRAAEPQRP